MLKNFKFDKLKKIILIGGFTFFFVKGTIWLIVILGAFFGISKF